LLSVRRRDDVFPTRLAGVIRSDDPDATFRACIAALEGGIGTIEVTVSIPSSLDIVRGLVGTTLGRLPVGLGMVWDAEVVPRARDAGASFIVTPVPLHDVAEACAREDILCLMSALTPAEIHRARRAGADVVKVYPVSAMGGPDYVRWLEVPLAGTPLWVEGGITIDQIPAYLSLGVAAVGLDTAVFPPEAVQDGDTALITTLARRAAASASNVFD
jgi:2-dehydro-3-deoxyphosphogluconate aldolase / (4S)-4-hydroxy-2-oxoglutarate aldolase